jgi:hypothetical protein
VYVLLYPMHAPSDCREAEDTMRLTAIVCCALALHVGTPRAGAAVLTPEPAKTFASEKWRVALDYPDTWSVEDDGDEVTFRSPNGQSVVLGRGGSGNPSEPAPGRQASRWQCTVRTSAHGVAATVCSDARSMTRRAVVVLKTRDGVASRLAISARGRDASAFDAIVLSLRRYP